MTSVGGPPAISAWPAWRRTPRDRASGSGRVRRAWLAWACSPAHRDAAWIALIGGSGVGYVLLKVAFGTNFFFHTGSAARLDGLQVWGTCALIAAESVCVRWRARPVAVFAAIMTLLVIDAVLVGDVWFVSSAPWLFAVTNLTARVRYPRWVPAIAVAMAADMIIPLIVFARSGGSVGLAAVAAVVLKALIDYALVVSTGWLAGACWRRLRLADASAASARRRHAALLAAGLAAERSRIAGGLNEVAARHLQEIRAGVRAARTVAGRSRQRAAELLEAAERECEAAVRSVRGVVSVLRADGGTTGGPAAVVPHDAADDGGQQRWTVRDGDPAPGAGRRAGQAGALVGLPRDLGNLAWFVLIAGTGTGYCLLQVALVTDFFQGPADGLRTCGICGVIAAQALCTRWRARPLAALAAVMALQTFAVILLPGAAGLAAGPAWLFAVCNVTARVRHPSRWAVALAIAAAADATSQLAAYARIGVHLSAYLGADVTLATLTSYAIVAPFGVLAGWYWRRADVVDAYAGALSREQAAVAAAGVAAERNRVARELHDVAAHHLYGTLLQIRAAASVLESKPGLAAELLETVEREAGLAAESLSGVVSLPQPGTGENMDDLALSRLPELIESVRASNPLAELTVDGDLAGLSAAVSLACYRIIQESLSNARRHAPGAGIAVEVRRDADEVSVEVRNTAPARGREIPAAKDGGFGVIGMRERATTLGGQLDSGPDENGGWVTRAIIPAGQRVAAGR